MMGTKSGMFLFLLAGALPAQLVESLALPDTLDSRPAALRLSARFGELIREAALQSSLGNVSQAGNITNIVASLQGLQNGSSPIPAAALPEIHVVSFYEGNPSILPGGPSTANRSPWPMTPCRTSCSRSP